MTLKEIRNKRKALRQTKKSKNRRELREDKEFRGYIIDKLNNEFKEDGETILEGYIECFDEYYVNDKYESAQELFEDIVRSYKGNSIEEFVRDELDIALESVSNNSYLMNILHYSIDIDKMWSFAYCYDYTETSNGCIFYIN